MRYLGSKTLLLNEIEVLAKEYSSSGVFCDPFGGIGTVGKNMKQHGYKIITGDVLYFAHCFQIAQIVNNGDIQFAKLRNQMNSADINGIELYLNTLEPIDGWVVEEYAKKRLYFTVENAQKIQACIDSIIRWKLEDTINEDEYKVLMASLIESFDKVANTAGTYYAYLKEFYRKATKRFQFKFIQPSLSNLQCYSYHKAANELVRETECDILYLDPPYNERDYSRYYHFPENVARGIVPHPTGKSGVYSEYKKRSAYNVKMQATNAFQDLIEHANAKCIIFHYTDAGLINPNTAREIMSVYGKTEEFYYQCKGYRTSINPALSQHHIIRVIK